MSKLRLIPGGGSGTPPEEPKTEKPFARLERTLEAIAADLADAGYTMGTDASRRAGELTSLVPPSVVPPETPALVLIVAGRVLLTLCPTEGTVPGTAGDEFYSWYPSEPGAQQIITMSELKSVVAREIFRDDFLAVARNNPLERHKRIMEELFRECQAILGDGFEMKLMPELQGYTLAIYYRPATEGRKYMTIQLSIDGRQLSFYGNGVVADTDNLGEIRLEPGETISLENPKIGNVIKSLMPFARGRLKMVLIRKGEEGEGA